MADKPEISHDSEHSHHREDSEENNRRDRTVNSSSDTNTTVLLANRFRQQISEEVGKALQAVIPFFMEEIHKTIDDAFEKRMPKLLLEKPGEHKEVNTGETKEETKKHKCTYKDFVASKPREFKGEVDPLISQRWITDIEAVFETSHCDASDQVIFAAAQLKDGAKDWWDVQKQEKGKDWVRNLTWDDFKILFLEHFCSQSMIDQITEEFLHLRHKDESIDNITRMFFDKARFCPDLMKTERMRINRYHNMLKAEYREFISPSKCATLQELINCAREREIELKKQVDTGEKRKNEKDVSTSKKMKFSGSSKNSNPKKNFRNGESSGKNYTGDNPMNKMSCYKCDKIGHLSAECSSPVNVCYRCYKPGHMKNECPELRGNNRGRDDFRVDKATSSGKNTNASKPRGRAFQITAEEAKATPDVVTGNASKSDG